VEVPNCEGNARAGSAKRQDREWEISMKVGHYNLRLHGTQKNVRQSRGRGEEPHRLVIKTD
jgi:hypothetical protein